MSNMTLAIPEALKKRMKEFPEVKWSEVARGAIASRLEKLELVEQLASKSKLTKEDIEIFDRKIKESASKRFHAESRH